jgi:type I restriction enzyme R subunit
VAIGGVVGAGLSEASVELRRTGERFFLGLSGLLSGPSLASEEIDLSQVELTHYRLTKQKEHQLNLRETEGGYQIRPVNEVGSGEPRDPEHKRLSEIIERLNELFGANVSDAHKLNFATGVADQLERDDTAMAEMRQNSRAQLRHGRFPARVRDIVMDRMNEEQEMSLPILDSDDQARAFTELIVDMLLSRQEGDRSGSSSA